MPGMNCAVADCRSSWTNQKNENFKLSFHRFPRKEELKNQWIIKCKRQDLFNPEKSRICSRHFKEDDYERDLKAELLGMKPKNILKSGAVPSKNIPLDHSSAKSAAGERRAARYSKKSAQEEKHRILESALNVQESTSACLSLPNSPEDVPPLSPPPVDYKSLYNELKAKCASQEKEIISLSSLAKKQSTITIV